MKKTRTFFARLDEGFLMREDKTIQSKSILFNDKSYTDKDYYKEYATIYHLRKELFENDEPKGYPAGLSGTASSYQV